MPVRILDTLTGSLQELPPPPYEVKLYVCGITPYSGSHIGHAVPAIVFDVLRRYLEYRGYTVRHVQNFTDIDDKLIDRANQLGTTVKALADQYSDQYMASLRKLNVIPATFYPRATEEIPRIVEIIEGLIANGYGYESGGDVYYRVRKKADYGKLSHRKIDDLLSGARVETTELKEDPLDFALWKTAKPGEPSWKSPWGPGRPGWHIECSAMSYGHLGAQIDIHGGGADLIFPHHENEIAQTEGFTGKTPFARIWMHNALLKMGAEKMSKSLGNIKDLDEVVDAYGADAVRVFIIASHYRSPLTFAEDALDAARKGAERLREAAFAEPRPAFELGGRAAAVIEPGRATAEFIAAMDEDLNSSKALASLFDLSHRINRARDEGFDISEGQAELRTLARLLGLIVEKVKVVPESVIALAREFRNKLRGARHDPGADRVQDYINASDALSELMGLRAGERAQKEWALSDSIRDRLAELGVVLGDSPDGPTWSLR